VAKAMRASSSDRVGQINVVRWPSWMLPSAGSRRIGSVRAACWAGGDIADWLGMLVRILQSRELRRQAELHTLFARA